VADENLSPLGRVSRDYTSPEIIRDISYGYPGTVQGHYNVQVELFDRKGTSLGVTNATYECKFTVTFHETNNLSGVSIQLYSDWDRTIPKGSALTTDTSGNATIVLEDGYVYWYTATKTGYVDLMGDVSVHGHNLTVNFHMPLFYAVTFNVTNNVGDNLPDVYMDIYKCNDGSWDYIDSVTTNTTGQATIDLLEGDEYYYYATKEGYEYLEGYFTVSGEPLTVPITMYPYLAYTVTFNETNGLSDVAITIYDWDWNFIDVVYTNTTGQATIDLLEYDYYYYADKSGYAEVEDDFTVSGYGLTVSFTMIPAYTVTFNETNGLSDVYIEVWDDIAEEWVGEVTTNETGQATIDLPDSSYYFYPYMDGYMDLEGNFTVSGANLTVPFEMTPVPFVTFNETNGLPDVYIDVYADSALTEYISGLWTDQFGQATIGLYEAGTYYYEAMMTGYGDLVGNFTISVSNITESFTMENGYYVLFIEDNSEMAILQLFSDSGLTIPASSPFATNEGGNATRELANGIYYYKATRIGFDDCTGNFTVSGEVVYEHFQMIPTAGVIFAEDFLGVGSGLPVGWITTDPGHCYVRGTSNAGGYVPELELSYAGDSETYSDYYVATPAINATGTSTSLNLSFKSYFNLYSDDPEHPYTYAVQTSDNDGANWTTVLEESPTYVTYPSGDFQRTENIDISACAGKTFRICWRLSGYTWWMDYWDIDDVLVTGS